MALPVDTSLLATPRRSPLERGLRLFTDVRAGEGVTALVMFANVFLILCAYYFVKPLRDGWIAIVRHRRLLEHGGQGVHELRAEPGPDRRDVALRPARGALAAPRAHHPDARCSACPTCSSSGSCGQAS